MIDVISYFSLDLVPAKLLDPTHLHQFDGIELTRFRVCDGYLDAGSAGGKLVYEVAGKKNGSHATETFFWFDCRSEAIVCAKYFHDRLKRIGALAHEQIVGYTPGPFG